MTAKSKFERGDVVRFFDVETNRHYVGNIRGFGSSGVWVAVPGHGPMLVNEEDLAHHEEPGSR